uniref:Exostosin GT47 domain-containing protein n=1 Tax=Kalanchoe fedtschenkoi TaxID=63787 RepID=A0A7N0REM6_KALFE
MKKPKLPNCHNHVCLIIFGSSFLASTMAYIYFSSSIHGVFAASRPHTSGSQPAASHDSLVPSGPVSQPNVTVVVVDDDPCSGKYIFIHQLPPKFNSDVLLECDRLLPMTDMCVSIQNDGFGPLIFNGSTGEGGFKPETWFATNQFTLELIFHKRMKQYPCLTHNSSSANALFVPFYAGLDAGRTLWALNTTVRDRVAIEFLNYISSLKEWKVMDGRDHFFVAGRIGWEFRRFGDNGSDWGNSLMCQPQSKHTSMLTIEASKFKNEVSIPYPTYFHPSTSDQVRQWQRSVEHTERRFLFAFAGALRPNQPGSIRNELFAQCLATSEECALLSCSNTFDPKCHHPLNVLKLFQNARFCLQPTGDSPTRRSTFDSIISGCIPVFFRMESGPEQYVWHFPRNYTSYSVYIPEEDVQMKKADIRSILSRIPAEKVTAMRREVIKMIPRVIYRNAGRGDGLEQKDAFDVAVEGILNRVENIKREFSSGIESGLYF